MHKCNTALYLIPQKARRMSTKSFTPSLGHGWPLPESPPGWFPWVTGRTLRCPRRRCRAAPAPERSACVSDFLTIWQSCRPDEQTGEKATHFSHVADGHQLADGRQVEAVHLVLHAARYLTVATAEVCDHQRRRPAGKEMCDFTALYWDDQLLFACIQ